MITIGLTYPSFIYPFVFDVIRFVISVLSLFLVVIPILKRDTSRVKSKNDKELLKESIIIALFKSFENIILCLLHSGITVIITPEFTIIIYYFNIIMENMLVSLSVLFLIYISTLMRKGVVVAFPKLYWIEKTTNKNNTVMCNSTVFIKREKMTYFKE